MATSLPILTHPNPQLRERSREIPAIDISSADIQELIADLVVTMHATDGIGIAAPQVGRSVRLICIGKAALAMTENQENFNPKRDLMLINPEIVKTSAKKFWGEEGCLSVPGQFGEVKRYHKVRVKAMDTSGEELTFACSDFLARVVQHEIDHLDGVLFIDKAKNIHRLDRDSKIGL